MSSESLICSTISTNRVEITTSESASTFEEHCDNSDKQKRVAEWLEQNNDLLLAEQYHENLQDNHTEECSDQIQISIDNTSKHDSVSINNNSFHTKKNLDTETNETICCQSEQNIETISILSTNKDSEKSIKNLQSDIVKTCFTKLNIKTKTTEIILPSSAVNIVDNHVNKNKDCDINLVSGTNKSDSNKLSSEKILKLNTSEDKLPKLSSKSTETKVKETTLKTVSNNEKKSKLNSNEFEILGTNTKILSQHKEKGCDREEKSNRKISESNNSITSKSSNERTKKSSKHKATKCDGGEEKTNRKISESNSSAIKISENTKKDVSKCETSKNVDKEKSSSSAAKMPDEKLKKESSNHKSEKRKEKSNRRISVSNVSSTSVPSDTKSSKVDIEYKSTKKGEKRKNDEKKLKLSSKILNDKHKKELSNYKSIDSNDKLISSENISKSNNCDKNMKESSSKPIENTGNSRKEKSTTCEIDAVKKYKPKPKEKNEEILLKNESSLNSMFKIQENDIAIIQKYKHLHLKKLRVCVVKLQIDKKNKLDENVVKTLLSMNNEGKISRHISNTKNRDKEKNKDNERTLEKKIEKYSRTKDSEEKTKNAVSRIPETKNKMEQKEKEKIHKYKSKQEPEKTKDKENSSHKNKTDEGKVNYLKRKGTDLKDDSLSKVPRLDDKDIKKISDTSQKCYSDKSKSDTKKTNKDSLTETEKSKHVSSIKVRDEKAKTSEIKESVRSESSLKVGISKKHGSKEKNFNLEDTSSKTTKLKVETSSKFNASKRERSVKDVTKCREKSVEKTTKVVESKDKTSNKTSNIKGLTRTKTSVPKDIKSQQRSANAHPIPKITPRERITVLRDVNKSTVNLKNKLPVCKTKYVSSISKDGKKSNVNSKLNFKSQISKVSIVDQILALKDAKISLENSIYKSPVKKIEIPTAINNTESTESSRPNSKSPTPTITNVTDKILVSKSNEELEQNSENTLTRYECIVQTLAAQRRKYIEETEQKERQLYNKISFVPRKIKYMTDESRSLFWEMDIDECGFSNDGEPNTSMHNQYNYYEQRYTDSNKIVPMDNNKLRKYDTTISPKKHTISSEDYPLIELCSQNVPHTWEEMSYDIPYSIYIVPTLSLEYYVVSDPLRKCNIIALRIRRIQNYKMFGYYMLHKQGTEAYYLEDIESIRYVCIASGDEEMLAEFNVDKRKLNLSSSQINLYSTPCKAIDATLFYSPLLVVCRVGRAKKKANSLFEAYPEYIIEFQDMGATKSHDCGNTIT